MGLSSSTRRRKGRKGYAEMLIHSAQPPRPLRLCVEVNLFNHHVAPAQHAVVLSTKIIFTVLLLLLATVIAKAQVADAAKASDALVVDGSYTSDVFGLGRDVRVRGEVRHGVIAFGGDVIIEGRVEGDAAAIGGSVIQLDGSYIGGDVMVFGGAYKHEGSAVRNPSGKTVMIAGYEQELRGLARNPASDRKSVV